MVDLNRESELITLIEDGLCKVGFSIIFWPADELDAIYAVVRRLTMQTDWVVTTINSAVTAERAVWVCILVESTDPLHNSVIQNHREGAMQFFLDRLSSFRAEQ